VRCDRLHSGEACIRALPRWVLALGSLGPCAGMSGHAGEQLARYARW